MRLYLLGALYLHQDQIDVAVTEYENFLAAEEAAAQEVAAMVAAYQRQKEEEAAARAAAIARQNAQNAQNGGGGAEGDGGGGLNPGGAVGTGNLGWPVPCSTRITSRYGTRSDPFTGESRYHSGIDIGCPEGTPIIAAAGGTAVFVGEKGGYGLLIVIQHSDGSFTIYAHNSKNLVKEGAKVKQGEKIALAGQTGRATGPHLHFEIRLESKAVDPLEHLPKTVP